MRTRDHIFTEVLVRNNRTTTDGFITDTNLKNWYTEANVWATSFHKWPFTEGKTSTTYSTAVTDDMGNALIQYPEGWKADSIRIVTVGGKKLDKLAFNSFLRFIEDNPNNTSRVYSDYARQLYVNVNADVSGTLTAYGQYMPIVDVTDETGITLFSDFDEEGNEAIVEKMSSYLKRREHLIDEAELHDSRAVAKLEEIWKRVLDEQHAYQTRNQNMFEDFDVIRGRGVNNQWFRRDQF
jgi:5S rRNA maturation endonuclease (ribonuclease M5)